jgi:hypothetical protein
MILNDWRVAEADLSELLIRSALGCLQYFVHAYVICDKYGDDLSHSCRRSHGLPSTIDNSVLHEYKQHE